MPGTFVPTGPIDPYYYQNQADRAARAMALFVADRRRKKEDELEHARSAAFEAAKGVADGSLPADAASVQARIAHYRQLDPEGAAELEMKLQFHTDVRKGLGTVRKAQLGAEDAQRAAQVQAALLGLPEGLRESVIKLGGFTEADWTAPKKPAAPPEPKTFAEAIMRGLSGTEPMGLAQAKASILAEQETKEGKAKAAKEAEARAAKQADAIAAAEQQVVTHRENRAFDVAHPLPSRARGAAKKEEKPEPQYSKDVYDDQVKANLEVLTKDRQDKRTPAQKDAVARIAARAALEQDPDVAAWILQALDIAKASGDEARALVAIEQKLREKKRI